MSDAPIYRSNMQKPANVNVFQAVIVYDSKGRPVPTPGKLVNSFTVTGASHDGRRAKALARARVLTGKMRLTISSTTDGGFAVTIPANR